MTNNELIRPGSPAAWLAFIRPKTLGLAFAPVLAALSLAYSETHHFSWIVGLFTLSLALLMQALSNMENDLGYTIRKAERSNRKGLPRATSNGWISIPAAKNAIKTTVLLILINTLVLIYFGGWAFLLIGIASALAAYGYMGGPKPIAYTPFGEITVLAFFGPVAVCGTYYLQTLSVSLNAVLLGIAVGSIASSVLAVNNWRDRVHDASINRQTLAVILGDKAFLGVFCLFLILPFILSTTIAFQSPASSGYLITLIPLLDCPSLIEEFQKRKGNELNEIMFKCVKLEIKFSVLFAAGAIINTFMQ